jgi:TBC1 domain family member 20
LINEVLRRHPYLCYFQGYHDICQVFLLVLDSPWRAKLVARLSVLRIRDFMLPSLAPTVAQLRLIPDIVSAADPRLRRHLGGTEPFYALAGTLTMYAHNIEGYRDIARLFDVLLAQEPVFSVYMFAQIVLGRREELFDTPSDDSSMLHFILSKVPQKLDLDALIADSVALFNKHPPESLPSWRRISSSSSLKTARSVETCAKQSIDDGRECFNQQLKQLEWMERRDRILKGMWHYRRPARALGLAVAVGILAFYLRRNPGPLSSISAMVSRWLYTR